MRLHRGPVLLRRLPLADGPVICGECDGARLVQDEDWCGDEDCCSPFVACVGCDALAAHIAGGGGWFVAPMADGSTIVGAVPVASAPATRYPPDGSVAVEAEAAPLGDGWTDVGWITDDGITR